MVYDLEYFISRCTTSNTGCWEWQKSKSDGYGQFGYQISQGKRKMHRVHRFVYELVNGPIAQGLVVRHKCRNRSCCNPDHLCVGTIAENNADSVDLVSKSKQGVLTHNAIGVIIDGKSYVSISQASRDLGISWRDAKRRALSSVG